MKFSFYYLHIKFSLQNMYIKFALTTYVHKVFPSTHVHLNFSLQYMYIKFFLQHMYIKFSQQHANIKFFQHNLRAGSRSELFEYFTRRRNKMEETVSRHYLKKRVESWCLVSRESGQAYSICSGYIRSWTRGHQLFSVDTTLSTTFILQHLLRVHPLLNTWSSAV